MLRYYKWCHWLFLLVPLQAAAVNGIAIDPRQVNIKENKIGYFYLYNETDNDYILNASVIDTETFENKESEKKIVPITISPPIRLIKARENARFSVIPLLKEKKKHGPNQYQIMVKVIPKTAQTENFTIPIILNFFIKLTIE